VSALECMPLLVLAAFTTEASGLARKCHLNFRRSRRVPYSVTKVDLELEPRTLLAKDIRVALLKPPVKGVVNGLKDYSRH
jgi:hypothetical protein